MHSRKCTQVSPIFRQSSHPRECGLLDEFDRGAYTPRWLPYYFSFTANGTLIAGGALLVINLGGDVEAQCSGVGSGAKAALVVLATGTGLSPARGAVRAAASGTDRTGGAATGLPGNAACNVGFTAGCGTIEHLSTAEFQSRIDSEVRKWARDQGTSRRWWLKATKN
jgi:hypothetical protein